MGAGAPRPDPWVPVGCGITPSRGKSTGVIPQIPFVPAAPSSPNPSVLRAFIPGFIAQKNRDKWEENTHTRRAGWVHVGTTSRCPLHPSRTWERPFLLQNNPRKTNILGAVSPPRRLPPAAPFAGIISAPRLINGVVTRQISSPELLLPSPRAVGGGNAGFHSDALGFNQGFFPGRIDYGKCR